MVAKGCRSRSVAERAAGGTAAGAEAAIGGMEAVHGGRRAWWWGIVAVGARAVTGGATTAVAQNAASLQVSAVVVELPAPELPRTLESEAREAAERRVGPGVGVRRIEVRSGSVAVLTQRTESGWVLVRVEYLAN
jgi:hypothetical protein